MTPSEHSTSYIDAILYERDPARLIALAEESEKLDMRLLASQLRNRAKELQRPTYKDRK